jgi:hypothetical protein
MISPDETEGLFVYSIHYLYCSLAEWEREADEWEKTNELWAQELEQDEQREDGQVDGRQN